MTQTEESTVPVEQERIDIERKQYLTRTELKAHGLLENDESIPNENTNANVYDPNRNPSLLENYDTGGRNESYPRSLEREDKSMHQPSDDSLTSQPGGGMFDSYYHSEQLIMESVHREPSLHNHQSFSIQHSGEFNLGPIPLPPSFINPVMNQTGLASSQHTPAVCHRNYDGSSTQAQPMSHEAGQGRIVTHNYSGIQNPGAGSNSFMSLRNKRLNEHSEAQPMSHEAGPGRVVTPHYSGVQNPGTGSSSLMSLRNKRLNEQNEGNNFGPQSLQEEEARGYVVMNDYSGQLNRDVPKTENPLSLRNKKLSDQNAVNYSVTSQHNSIDQTVDPHSSERLAVPNESGQPSSLGRTAQTVDQSSVHSNQRMVMPNYSGEVQQANKQSMWSMENHCMNEQNASLNRSVGAPHSSQMPADLGSDQENQDDAIITPSQSKNQGRQNAPPAADQTRGSAHRNLVGPHGFVRDAHQHESLVNQSANNMLNVRQHTGNGGISIQARDNRGNPSHLPSQSNQFIIPSHQQHPRQQSNPPGQYGNPPEQQQNNPVRQYANPPRQFNNLPGQSYTTGRQFNQPMDLNHRQSQTSDGRQQRRGKKVFILHYDDVPPDSYSSVLQLATTLRNLEVDVTIDLFIRDQPPNSWPLWFETNIQDSDVVLCMITENFYHNLTTGSNVTGYSLYNLMNLSTIAVRAVFLNVEKNMDFVPPSMRGATCYCLRSGQLSIEHEEFASLYAFLTGQNRIEKPALGKMVTLTPRRSRFGGGQHTAAPSGGFNRGPPPGGMGQPHYNIGQTIPGGYNMGQPPHGGYNMGQPPHGGFNRGQLPHMAANRGQYPPAGFNKGPPPQQQFQQSSYGAPSGPPASQPDVDQANLLYSLLAGDTTAVMKVRSHNKMFQVLATKMAVEWEPLARTLGLRDAEIYAIRRDNEHSVIEQAVQMFRAWMEKNGSNATVGVLTTAIYDTGMQYWNLLDIVNKHLVKPQ